MRRLLLVCLLIHRLVGIGSSFACCLLVQVGSREAFLEEFYTSLLRLLLAGVIIAIHDDIDLLFNLGCLLLSPSTLSDRMMNLI